MEPTAMSTFLTNVGTVITQIITWLGNVATALLSNEIFQILMAVLLFTLLFGVVVGLARSIKARKRGKK